MSSRRESKNSTRTPRPPRQSWRDEIAHLGRALWQAAQYWSSDNVSTTGAALAFYCAFSLAPLIVILLSLAGPILGAASTQAALTAQLSALFGASTAKILLGAAYSSTQQHGFIATATSIVSLLFGATTVLSALQTALDQIWESGSLVQAGVFAWIRARFLSLGFILALGFLLLVSLTVSTALTQAQRQVADGGAGHWIVLFGVVDFLMSLSIIAFLFALIFRYMPARRLEWRRALLGGAVTAALFELGRWLVGLYLAHSTQPSAFGAASSFAALLLWLYYTAQIFLFGAEFTAVLAELRHVPSGAKDKTQAAAAPGKRRLTHQPG
ncbi:MAG TPA: YihY/virulence factor BrkB family protein [Steroidobacteraceae bacterium]|jgi:membrane protein